MIVVIIVCLLLATGLMCALVALSSLARLEARPVVRPERPDPPAARAPRLTRLGRPIAQVQLR